jgi:hypothetical protein
VIDVEAVSKGAAVLEALSEGVQKEDAKVIS